MKLFLTILLLTSSLFASKNDIFRLYENKNYLQACKEGKSYLANSRNDESFVNLYAFSCLNADWIDSLAVPITMLKYSKESRNNASYFSIILMQKKLLYSALIDDYKIEQLNLPTTKHVLSKVFDLYAQTSQNSPDKTYYFTDKDDKRTTYKLSLLKGSHIRKMVIEVYYDKILKDTHTYW